MISVSEADRLLEGLLPPPSVESLPLAEAAGRVLAQAVVADRNGPPYDRVAMDGYAVATAEAGRRWLVEGLQCAGRPPLQKRERGTALEVATGAVLPQGCDAVIPYEDTDTPETEVVLKADRDLPLPWRHVHRQGSDYRQGQELLTAGTRLRSVHVHTLASVGIDSVAVVRRARWALAATGDELVEVHQKPLPWQIRRSNGPAIAAEAGAWGLSPHAQTVLPDDRAKLRSGLEALLPDLDVLVLTGGVSAGVLDLVPGTLKDLGAEVIFHRIAQRPGKPLWCGRLPETSSGPGTVVFGLPGNPVSSLFSFRRYVLPWLLAFEGRKDRQQRRELAAPLPEFRSDQTVFLPWSDQTGLLPWTGSGDFSGLAGSTGFLEINDHRSQKEPRYYAWGGDQ